MRIATCPTTTAHAQPEIVWHLLTDPASYELWSGATFVRATPPGYAHAGQRIELLTHALGLSFPVRFDIGEVDEENGRIRVDVALPFGVVNHETIKVSPLGEAGTFVSFN